MRWSNIVLFRVLKLKNIMATPPAMKKNWTAYVVDFQINIFFISPQHVHATNILHILPISCPYTTFIFNLTSPLVSFNVDFFFTFRYWSGPTHVPLRHNSYTYHLTHFLTHYFSYAFHSSMNDICTHYLFLLLLFLLLFVYFVILTVVYW